MITDFKHAMLEMRKAQRLVVAFHQRILPVINEIADKLDCKFYYWDPTNHNRPVKGNKEPFSSWSWDYSPMNDAFFIFLSKKVTDSNIANKNDWGLVIRLVSDSGISDSFRNKSQNWDALNLSKTPEESQTRLDLIAYKINDEIIETDVWWNIYAKTDFPPITGEMIKGYKGVNAFFFSANVEELVTETGVQSVVKLFKDKLVSNDFISSLEEFE